jgi:hypothetical protein
VKHRKKLPDSLHDAMDQAEKPHDGEKSPMVVLHENRQRYEDSFIVMRLGNVIEKQP